MQDNEFEKRVQKQMEEFVLVPNEEVWKQLEAKIRKEKRRRVLFYWVFAGLLLTGGTGILFFLNTVNNSQVTNVSSDKTPANGLVVKKPGAKKKDEISVEEKDLKKEDATAPAKVLDPSAASKNTNISRSKKTYSSKATPIQDAQEARAQPEASNVFNNENKISQPDKPGDYSVNSSITRMEGRTILPPHKYLLSHSDQKLQPDTLQKSEAAAEHKTGIRDTSALSIKDNDNKQNSLKNIRKLIYGFTIYGGVSDNVSGIGLGSQKSFLAERNNSFSSQFPSASASPLQHRSAGSFGGGAYLQKALTKKLSVTVGVDYHFMSTKSWVGNQVVSTLNVYDSALRQSTIANIYYRGGQSTSYSNQYHLIQLPVNLRVQLNKNINHPVLFSFGLSPSFLISSDALYLNSNAQLYYRQRNQFTHFMLFGQSELVYTLSNKSKYQLSVGPVLQYGLNSFSKAATYTRQHLLFTGIKTNISF